MQPSDPTNSPNAWPELADSSLLRRGMPLDVGGSAERGAGARKLLDIVLRGRWLILAILVLFVVPTSIYMAVVPSRYQAYALVRIDPPVTPNASDLFSQGGGASGAGSRFLSNEILVLNQSLFLAEETASKLIEMSRSGQDDLRVTTTENGELLTPRELALRLQGRRLNTDPEGRGGLDVVRISATSTVPAEAAAIANAHADAYVQRTQERSRESAAASREFLEKQYDLKEEELGIKEDRIRAFMTREGAIVAPESEAASLLSQLSTLEEVRDETVVLIDQQEATLAAIQRRLSDAEPYLIERVKSDGIQRIRLLQQRRAALEVELQEAYAQRPGLQNLSSSELRATGNTGILDFRTRLDSLNAEIAELAPRYVASVLETGGLDASGEGGELSSVAGLQSQAATTEIELFGLRSRLAALDARTREYENQVDRLPSQAIELAQLQRDRDLAEETFRILGQKLNELRIAEQAELGYAEIVRPALTPGSPFWPNRYRNILLSIILGLGCGFGGAVLMTWLDNRISRPEDLRELGQTVIGVIPDMNRLIKDDFGGAESIQVDGQRIDTKLVSLLNPLSTTSEAYRGLRTAVQFSRPDVVVQVIVLTSPAPSEGKSITASNLALVMAQAGRRTLLVDADLRKPSLHKKFGIPREPGLRDLLFQEGEDMDFDRFTGPAENLWVVPSGGTIPNPSELVSSKRMREMLHIARSKFDVIIMDAPPVLPATDAVLLSTQADATILVVAAGRSRRHEIELTLESLNSVGAPIIGAVLNQFDVSQSYAYKYRYKYRYSGAYSSDPAVLKKSGA